jgi:hypothetical protein
MSTTKLTTNQMLEAIMGRLGEIEDALAASVTSVASAEPDDVIIVEAPPAPKPEAHNELVEVRVLTLFHYDGDPATEGTEIYAPKGYDFDEVQLEGLHERGLDDAAIATLPDRLMVTRLVADAFVKAGIAAPFETEKG